MTPDFAKPILEARERGQRPAEMVIVSDGDLGLHRRFPSNPVVRVRPEQRPSELSWRFLAGLSVEIATCDSGARAMELALSIDAVFPDYLRVWYMPTNRAVRVRCFGRPCVTDEAWVLCQ